MLHMYYISDAHILHMHNHVYICYIYIYDYSVYAYHIQMICTCKHHSRPRLSPLVAHAVDAQLQARELLMRQGHGESLAEGRNRLGLVGG